MQQSEIVYKPIRYALLALIHPTFFHPLIMAYWTILSLIPDERHLTTCQSQQRMKHGKLIRKKSQSPGFTQVRFDPWPLRLKIQPTKQKNQPPWKGMDICVLGRIPAIFTKGENFDFLFVHMEPLWRKVYSKRKKIALKDFDCLSLTPLYTVGRGIKTEVPPPSLQMYAPSLTPLHEFCFFLFLFF